MCAAIPCQSLPPQLLCSTKFNRLTLIRRAAMSDIDKALSDIVEIRSRIAAGTAFRGYGPLAIAVTGGIGF